MRSNLTLQKGRVIGVNVGGNKFHANDAHTSACEDIWKALSSGPQTRISRTVTESFGASFTYVGERGADGSIQILRGNEEVVPILIGNWSTVTTF